MIVSRAINRGLLVAGLLIGGALSAVAQPPQAALAWRESSPENEEFTVNFPAEPRMTTGKRFFGDRQNNYKFHFYSVVTNNTLFLVESYEGDRPKDLLRILMSGRRGITGVADVELNGIKGKEFSHDIENLSFKGRYFATKKHAYVVEAARRGAYDESIDHFLNSFILEHHAGGVLPLGASATADDEIFPARELDAKAIVLFKLPATYTDEARARKLRGTVVVDAVFRATGEVTDIHVRRGIGGGLDEQSIEATKAIAFVPALKDGKPVSQRLVLEYNFNIY